MRSSTSTPVVLLAFALTAIAQQPTAPSEPFPASTALAEGVSPEALAGLGALVQSLVDEEEVVGAELLVIKNGRSILHEAFGWSDREADVPMRVGSLFCVRSMTKPVIGAAVLMLVDDEQLALDDKVASRLPAFDVDGKRDITVEQLLTHTSGLPMSLLLGKDLREIEDIQAVAALGGACELEFEPGSGFNYSDQGTDTLTALIEVVSGMPAADFVRTRVLAPLGMEQSACVLDEDDPLRARALPKYAGTRGQWSRFWSPDDAPLFPCFLGSQGLYSTLEDYARFMSFWLHKGRVGKERLLGARFVRQALTPGPHPMKGSTGFAGLRTEYGFLMQLWIDASAAEEREPVVFGHSGSDGTYAWVFPEQDAMAFFFTQSRGNGSGLRVEEALGHLFLGAPFDANEAAPPFEQYQGFYWEGEGDLYRAIVRDGDDLALEIVGKAVVPLTYVGDDRWKLRPDPSKVLAFQRDESGRVTGYDIGEHHESRFEPASELPSFDTVAELVQRAHRIDLVDSLGPVRMRGSLVIEARDVTGETTTLLAGPDRWRYDTRVGEELERVAFDGERVWYESRLKPRAELEGLQAAAMRIDVPFVRYGNWQQQHAGARVMQRLEKDGRMMLLVRMGGTEAPARTLYVEEETGLVRGEASMTYVDSLGRIGQLALFDDYRDVSGMQLPFRTRLQLAHALIPPMESSVAEVELGVELPAGTFELAD